MHRNIRHTLLALGVTLLIIPAAVSEGHEPSPDTGVTQHVR